MVISTIWPPPTSHPASSWISPLRLIPFVRLFVDHRPDEISPVPSSTFTTSRSPYAGGSFTAAFPGSSPLQWPSLLAHKLGFLFFFPFGLTFRCCKTCPELVEGFTLCCGLLLRSPFSGGYKASAHPVAQMHWLPATWPPDSYHDRTCIG